MQYRVRVKTDTSGIDRAKTKFHLAMRKTIDLSLAYGINQAMKNSPVKTGHLRRSIHVIERGEMSGAYGTNVIYGPIQEFGGTIRPKRKKYLTFKVNGQWVRAKSVTIRGKFYMKRSAEALQRALPQLARKAVREVGLE